MRGLGKPARRAQVREYVAREKIDIIGLQETVKTEFSNQDFQEIGGMTAFY